MRSFDGIWQMFKENLRNGLFVATIAGLTDWGGPAAGVCQGAGLMVAGIVTDDGGIANLVKAEEFYRTTQYAPALALLKEDSTNASALDLIGRIYYMQGDYHRATDFLSKALQAAPTNSKYADWLGRAWGRRASSGGLTAAGYASKARGYFERAVQLDPKNVEALNDLFEYYLQAPGFLGGGSGKAVRIAEQIAVIDPADGYAKRARIAEKKKDYSGAEDSLRHAVQMAPNPVDYQIQLATLLAQRGRETESDALFAKAEQDFPNAPGVWFAHAELLVHQNRNLDEAKRLLEKYMQTSTTSADPPKREAEKLLRRASGGA